MSYVRETLANGERVIQSAQFNWTYFVSAYFWCIFGNSTLAYALYAQARGTLPGDPAWVLGLAIVPAVLGILILLGHLIHVQTTEIAVTSTRFIYKKGLISRRTKEVSLNKIEEIRLQQSVFGRMFGYGCLTLHGTGVGVISLPEIDNPITFRKAIEGAKAKLREAPEDRNYSQLSEQDNAPVPRPDLVAAKKPRKRKPSRRKKGAPAPEFPQKLR